MSENYIPTRYQVRTGHPHFFNQLSQGLDILSMAGEWLAATANANMFTYEIAPVFIMMEHEVLVKMRDIIGWSEGDSILAPGGSISNMYAIIIARHKLFPDHKEKGMMALDSQPVCYTSKHVSKVQVETREVSVLSRATTPSRELPQPWGWG